MDIRLIAIVKYYAYNLKFVKMMQEFHFNKKKKIKQTTNYKQEYELILQKKRYSFVVMTKK